MPFNWKRQSAPRKSREEKQREYIEQIAYELYQNRLLLGRPGDAQSDWKKAAKIVRSPWKTTLFASNRPLIQLEKRIWEPFNRLLKQSAVFDIVDRLSPALEAIGVLLIPLVLYLASQAYENQREAKENERLQQEAVQNYINQLSEIFLNVEGDLQDEENERIRTIATAATITLLRDSNLDEQRRGQVVSYLSQMNLVQGEFVYGPQRPEDKVPDISLNFANLFGASLGGASLNDANLFGANLSGANLNDANLRGANLSLANLSDTDLNFANLSGADLNFADLRGANLGGANLSGANLNDANLNDANLRGADLSLADLRGANLSLANLSDTDLNFAYLCYTQLPDRITLDPNRDCEELGIDPETGLPTYLNP